MLESVYLVLLFLIAFIEIIRKKTSVFDFFTLFSIVFSLLYPLPAFLLALDFANAANELSLRNSLDTNTLQTALAIYAGYFVVLIGFHAKSALKLGKRVTIKTRRNQNAIIFNYAIALMLVTILSIYIYGIYFGGIGNALEQAMLVRLGYSEDGQFGFVRQFTYFSLLASYLICSFIFTKKITKKNEKFLLCILFALSFILVLITVILAGSRGHFLYYICVLCLSNLIAKKRIPWFNIITYICFAALFIIYGKAFFFSLSAISDGFNAVAQKFTEYLENDPSNTFSLNFYNIMSNFQFPVNSLDAALSRKYQFRWFADIVYGLIVLLPDRLLGTTPPETIVSINSRYIIGNNDFSIPTGFLAFGVYSMWWPGLLIVCFTYGWIGRYLQTILTRYIHDTFWIPWIYCAVAQMWLDLMTSDPEIYFGNHLFFLIATLGCVFLASSVSLKPEPELQKIK